MSISPLVLVVGMHRSGTSMLGGILQKLGVGLPGELVSADEHNPAGYHEWDRVVSIQERLLIDLDRWWPICRNASLSSWGGFNTWPQFEHRCLCVSFSPGRSIISRPYGA